jgi:hypothetical protein
MGWKRRRLMMMGCGMMRRVV